MVVANTKVQNPGKCNVSERIRIRNIALRWVDWIGIWINLSWEVVNGSRYGKVGKQKLGG